MPAHLKQVRGRLIVSCQAWEDDAFHGAGLMAKFARAAYEGGACGIRANSPDDVRDIRAALDGKLPVIAIQKRHWNDGRILITPEIEDCRALAAAGADMVAVDCTARGQRYGALDRIRFIESELKAVAGADIATVEEALAAQEAGASFILSTMRGFTDETARVTRFEPGFIEELVRVLRVPVIAEGRISTPEEAQAALAAGAYSVVVGSAITRPKDITTRFVRALRNWSERNGCYLGVDLGGTNIKSGIVMADGTVRNAESVRTPVAAGRDAILQLVSATVLSLRETAQQQQHLCPLAVGISTAGWPDPSTGSIWYGTGNLPDWTGAPVAAAIREAVDLPVFVENDANALAVGERHFGSARDCDNFLCVTLGTGIGAGCFLNGALVRGAHFQASALGHIEVEPGGLECTCGRRGCLEPYANAAALLRYSGPSYGSARRVLGAARAGDENAQRAIAKLAEYLGRGLRIASRLLDPQRIILAGGLAQDNAILVDAVADAMAGVPVSVSTLGYHGGVAGAGAVARSGIS
ncbi:MAG: putative N-acetylmannosamine-6-phosphate 2-epimerase [Acidobacteria bacterium]|nr:putative N-acetylmannosamine-6-phosphate 2-epimerase [Acidobacteriota bacterium]